MEPDQVKLRRILIILRLLSSKEGIFAEDVMKAVGISRSTFFRNIALLRKIGLIITTHKTGHFALYRLEKSSNELVEHFENFPELEHRNKEYIPGKRSYRFKSPVYVYRNNKKEYLVYESLVLLLEHHTEIEKSYDYVYSALQNNGFAVFPSCKIFLAEFIRVKKKKRG